MALKRPTLSYEEARKASQKERILDVRDNLYNKSENFKHIKSEITETLPERPSTTDCHKEINQLLNKVEKPIEQIGADAKNTNLQDRYVRVIVPHPHKGVSARYDIINEMYDESTAIRAVLKEAMKCISSIPDLTIITQNMALYRHTKANFETNRTISHEFYDQIKTAFDPLGIASDYAIGKQLGHVALTLYFNTESKSG